ncbi:MAG: zinc ribbon domain-containing protein, partial [Thermodesulfobacteriota bacterium]
MGLFVATRGPFFPWTTIKQMLKYRASHSRPSNHRRTVMPIYEFRCQECKALFEAIVASCEAIKDVTCKKCGSARVEKTISAGSFRIAS